MKIESLIETSLERRSDLIQRLNSEKTDSFRVFHGTTEGLPGLTVDIYGKQLLVQTFYEPITEATLLSIKQTVESRLSQTFRIVYHDRSPEHLPLIAHGEDDLPGNCSEFGLRYTVNDSHTGQDPLLFLDFRAGRRYVLENSSGATVLNLFAYTCGIGLCAAAGGAKEVWNVDFSKTYLDYGRTNASLNNLDQTPISYINEDVLAVIRQLSGLGIKGKARRRKFIKFKPRSFDLVVLDPPTRAKSPFGAVDLVGDYQSMFKPALLCTSEGGRLLCTNHAAGVSMTDWMDILSRCARKAGRPIKKYITISPEADFPSPDMNPPLKIAVVSL